MSPTDRPTAFCGFTPDQVRALLLGRGPAGAVEGLARHLPDCPGCAAVAEAVCLDDGVVSGLRRDDLPPAPTDDELADVVARIGRLGRPSWADRSQPVVPATEVPGRLGPYRLVELLGVGGMGVVYRAEDTNLHRFVAVKVLKDGASARSREQFLSEARALASVRHDNVVTVYHVGEEPAAGGTVPYLAMELLEGQTLRDWMTANPRPPAEWVVRLGRQAAAGLAFSHDVGLVHRDVKPANLWLEAPRGWAAQPPEARAALGGSARVKLLDFGIARSPGSAAVSAAGTPAYMAPEQARCENVDGRADLFGLGCVLYELCTGALPFPRRNRNWAGETEAAPAPVHARNPAIPERLANLIARLLAEDRADRPASARAVELELAALADASSGVSTVSAHADATVVIPSGRRSHRRLLALAPALLLAAGAVAAIAYSDRTDTAPHSRDEEFVTPPPTLAEQADPPITDQPQALVSSRVVDEEWCRTLATLPPQQQLNTVFRMLGQLNPRFDWLNGSGWVEPDGVRRMTVDADSVSDLRPLRALPILAVLRCRGSAPGLGILTDLSPLSELKLKELHCRNNPGLRDLSPIQLDRLDFLDASYTGLETLAGLAKSPVVTLKIAGTPVRDLDPVRTMSRLRTLDCTGCPVTDFEPLTALPLRELSAHVTTDRDAAVLRRMKTLVKINGMSAREFWKARAAEPK